MFGVKILLFSKPNYKRFDFNPENKNLIAGTDEHIDVKK
jgi:hypothetical protein